MDYSRTSHPKIRLQRIKTRKAQGPLANKEGHFGAPCAIHKNGALAVFGFVDKRDYPIIDSS